MGRPREVTQSEVAPNVVEQRPEAQTLPPEKALQGARMKAEILANQVQVRAPGRQQQMDGSLGAFDDRPDYAGIAAELSMPIGSIGPTRCRCLDKLKALLNKDGGRDHE